MRCSVVYSVTLRLLVINIASSSLAVNTAAYYQRCVITCETVAVVHRRPCLQHLALTQAVKRQPDIGSESRFLPTPPAFNAPVRVGSSHWNIAIPFGMEKLEWCGYTKVKKLRRYLYSFWQNVRTWQTDRRTNARTDALTPHNGIGRACIASRGKNCFALKAQDKYRRSFHSFD